MIVEATAFGGGIVIAQVNEIVDTLPRVDIPADWVNFVVQAPRPNHIEPLFTRDPAQISDLYSRTVAAGIFDAPLEFAYMARPFQLRPNTAAAMPEVSADFRSFTLRLKPGILFDDDAAFAKLKETIEQLDRDRGTMGNHAFYLSIPPKAFPLVTERLRSSGLAEVMFPPRSAMIGQTVYQGMGIDVWEVIDAAKTKPFGFMAFYPGPGLGGHCIPIDPYYLTWKAKEFGHHTRFIELAGEINESMPEYVVSRVTQVLNDRTKSVRGSRILIMGLAYKANVDDMRESPSFRLMDLLKSLGADISYYDPHIPVILPTREHAVWTGLPSVSWDQATITGFDLVLLVTHHAKFNLDELVAWAEVIVDTRNALVATPARPGQVHKA